MARKKQVEKRKEESWIDEAKHKAKHGFAVKKTNVIGELTKKDPLMASIVGATLMGGDVKNAKREHVPKNHSSMSQSTESSIARQSVQKKKEQDPSAFLTFQDYQEYMEPDAGERPEVIEDIIHHLTGKAIQHSALH